ncbi:mitochondrial ribosomal protein subunit-domain-containing protein [Amylocystis lapponica]|nr:mitochondrial ribosomal protein subunit-domain-containing protein [Amylocystis lapponica]
MATPPPSQFSALLRQSKFASFDPSISQVYTSYGGHTHRGNWGLKRPLPLRRRNASITVRAVDSREQQTEWKSAEPQNRWIRMWDEVGVTPTVGHYGAWREKLGPLGEVQWLEDSDLVRGSEKSSDEVGDKEVEKTKSMAVPNIQSMSDKEFARYLEKLREMRPAFLQFVKDSAAKRKIPSSTLWEQAQRPGNLPAEFLASHAHTTYSSDARIIEQRPHRFAGLNYTKSSNLQTYLLQKPQRGRILQTHAPSRSSDLVVGFAGMTPTLGKNSRGQKSGIDWQKVVQGERDPQSGVAKFRIVRAQLNVPPTTVGENAGGLAGVAFETDVRTDAEGEDMSRPNTHTPGSREYVGAEGAKKTVTPMLVQSTRQQPRFTSQPTDSASLLAALDNICSHIP